MRHIRHHKNPVRYLIRLPPSFHYISFYPFSLIFDSHGELGLVAAGENCSTLVDWPTSDTVIHPYLFTPPYLGTSASFKNKHPPQASKVLLYVTGIANPVETPPQAWRTKARRHGPVRVPQIDIITSVCLVQIVSLNVSVALHQVWCAQKSTRVGETTSWLPTCSLFNCPDGGWIGSRLFLMWELYRQQLSLATLYSRSFSFSTCCFMFQPYSKIDS